MPASTDQLIEEYENSHERKMSEVIQKQRNQSLNIQKQSCKGVLMERCSEISSRTPMPKCDFHVDAKQLY